MTTHSRTRTRRCTGVVLSAVGPTVLLSAIGCSVLVAGCGGDVGGTADTRAAVQALKAAHPRANVHVQGDRIRRLYGPVAKGETPKLATESFRQSHAATLGVEPADLVAAAGTEASMREPAASAQRDGVGLMYDPATGKHKFRLFTYQQQRDGVPVFRGAMRTLVREGEGNTVVWANADLRPLGSFRAQSDVELRSVDLVKSLQALSNSTELAGQMPAPTALVKVSDPTRTIFAGAGAQNEAPRMAMQYTARDANGLGKWTFVADAVTGEILHIESNLHSVVNGTVKGQVITGPESIECGTLGTAPLPYAQITSSAGNALTDATGAFTIAQSGSAAVTLTSNVTGKYVKVIDARASSHSLSLKVTPPGPANFVHSDPQSPPEKVLAQVNAYKYVNDLRDLLLKYAPQYPVIAEQTNFEVNVNLAEPNCDSQGGAWYDDDVKPRTLNFCQSTAERANTAFRGVIHHEFGHHIIDSGDSGQAEYGEGMADTIAMLFSKDPRIAIGYHRNKCNEPLRNGATNCQFIEGIECSSCGSDLYGCGGLISGIVWDIWKQLDASEPGKSDDIIRSLVFNSIPMHTGTKIDGQIAIDLLALDDDDGLPENGTPHYQEICAGFEQHAIKCPPILDGLVLKGDDLAAEGPIAGPFQPTSVSYAIHNLGPQQDLTYSVKIPSDARWLTVDSTGGTVALGQKTTVTVSIDQAQAALLPEGKYTAKVDFVNATSGVGTVSRTVKLRVGAPVPIYTATFSNLSMDGFTIDSVDGNLWHSSASCRDGLSGHTSGGSLYYGKDATCAYDSPVPYRHTVTSPAIKITDPSVAELGFKYSLTTENNSEHDKAEVALSVNGGPFEVVAGNKSGGIKMEESNTWRELRFDMAEWLPATGPASIQVQFSFNAMDIVDNLREGFVVDDVTVYGRAQSAGCSSNAECDDGNPCTNDSCDSVAGCKHENNTASCADDGNACTKDVCNAGACTHPDSGTCTTQGPCAGYCTNPIKFSTSNHQSGNLGTNATCHETTAKLSGGNCGNFASSRQLMVNGVAMTCNWATWKTLPAVRNGGYCISTTSGDNAWASFSTW